MLESRPHHWAELNDRSSQPSGPCREHYYIHMAIHM
jgi:hypothetical protein